MTVPFDIQTAYAKIQNLSQKTKTLQGVSYLLEWDQETYMPDYAGHFRGEQLKLLAAIIHKERTSKTFSNALGKLIDLKTGHIKNKGLHLEQEAALKEWQKDYRRYSALPSRLVEEMTKLSSSAQLVWRECLSTFCPIFG
jgi:carboxypeptidase Taq